MNRGSRAYSGGYTLVELIISLVIASLIVLAATQILLVNQGYYTRMVQRSELMASAITAKELLRQSVWKAGHSTATQQAAIAIGINESSRVSIGYVLDSRGIYLSRNCVGNYRSGGQDIEQTLDDWYVHQDGSLYCKPNVSAGASLSERIGGANFVLVHADSYHSEGDTSRFITSVNTQSNQHVRAVTAELVFLADQPPATSKSINSPFSWSLARSAQADYSIFWQLVMPVGKDINN